MEQISSKLNHVLDRIANIELRLRELDPQYQSPVDPSQTDSRFANLLYGIDGGNTTTAAFTWPTVSATETSSTNVTPELAAIIERASTAYGIRQPLLHAIIQAESGFNPRAVSPRGALGLMQLMPDTASSLGVTDPFNAQQNIEAGARYFRQALDKFDGDERLALAAYNAGPGAVQRYHGIPPYQETQRYVTRVMSLAGEK
ncbi:MAG: lytic transglycosylase domain-containing protein [Armatimonadota bacterium]